MKKKQKKSCTIQDVAALAGISVTTVSNHLRGLGSVSKEAEERINRAVTHLGYRPRPRGKRPRKLLGVVLINIKSHQFSRLVEGANRAATECGYGLLFIENRGTVSSKEVRQLSVLSRRVDGFIASSRIPEDHIMHIMRLGKPAVFVGRTDRPDLPHLGCDGYKAGRLLGDFLYDQGHRRITYFGVTTSRWNEVRFRGLMQSLEERGIRLDTVDLHGEFPNETESACALVLQRHIRPDAIVCYHDMVAINVMQSMAKFGVRIPADMSVAGFDNIQLGEYTSPTLTTVDMQSEHMGELAVRYLLRQMNEGTPIGSHLFEPTLIVRGSTIARPKNV
jgi:DNA-binding LacI/PurR family transcriptional regulator